MSREAEDENKDEKSSSANSTLQQSQKKKSETDNTKDSLDQKIDDNDNDENDDDTDTNINPNNIENDDDEDFPQAILNYPIDGKGLAIQNYSKLNFETLSPLTPEVMSRQATINIGTIGHVAHGKSTVVKALSTVKTVRFKSELERNITIKLGYANAKIYKASNPKIPRPDCYHSWGSETPDVYNDRKNKTQYKLQRHVSFVDCPGHDILMATMLNGAAVMDAALLLVAGNEPCPQPQTSEHLAAVEIMKLSHIIILQNKIDLVTPSQAAQQCEEIRNFVRGTVADQAPIIPISAQLQYNIDAVCEYILKIPSPIRDFTSSPQLIVIRSFDVNKPGAEPDELQGGVAGGSILKGILRLKQDIEIRPGIIKKGDNGIICEPIKSQITSLYAEKNNLEYAVPGGLIGVGTNIDPTLTRADRLVGQVLGEVDKLPDVYIQLEISFFLLRKLLGVRTDAQDNKKTAIKPLEKGEILMVNIGSTSTGGKVLATKKDLARIHLTSPVCTHENAKLALSRRVDRHWRLIGWGNVLKGLLLKGSNNI